MAEVGDGSEFFAQHEMATNVGPGGIDIAFQRLGNREAPALLLILGVVAQLIHWPDEFCAGLIDAGLQVIRFDNRDSGLSSHMKDAVPPDLAAVLAGDLRSASFNLTDMAADAVGLMDPLGIRKAHIVGASMGGQIAQIIATDFPDRVCSLVSMMSTTGNKSVGQVSPEALREIFGGSPGTSCEEVVRHRIKVVRAVGSPAYPADESEIAARAGLAYDRSHDPIAMARQAVATVASGDRTESLRRISAPTLVIHGLSDKMCAVSGGRGTAEAIPNAELVLIEGMGHDLARGLRSRIASLIAEFVWRVEKPKTPPSASHQP